MSKVEVLNFCGTNFYKTTHYTHTYTQKVTYFTCSPAFWRGGGRDTGQGRGGGGVQTSVPNIRYRYIYIYIGLHTQFNAPSKYVELV